MLIQSGIGSWLNLCHCREGAISQIILEIGVGDTDSADIFRVLRGNRLSPLEIFDVTGLQQTRRIVGWPSATGVRGIHVDLPAHPRGYQLLKDRRSSQQTLVT